MPELFREERNETKAWAFVQREWSQFSRGILETGNTDEFFDARNRDVWLPAFYAYLEERQGARLRVGGPSND